MVLVTSSPDINFEDGGEGILKRALQTWLEGSTSVPLRALHEFVGFHIRFP